MISFSLVAIGPGARHSSHEAAGPLRRPVLRTDESFTAPVTGPIAVGHSCHFGLGLFLPAGALE